MFHLLRANAMPRKINRTTWRLFVRYLAGECSPREEARVRAEIAVSEEKGQFFDALRRIWEAAEQQEQPVDVIAARKELRERIQQAARIQPLPTPHASPSRRSAAPSSTLRRRPSSAGRLLRVAAVIAIAAVTVLLVWQLGKEPLEAPMPERKVFATQKGERATIYLTDGTRVRLNADSRLVLAEGFATGRRQVRLKGEAYFEVAKDAAHPFTIYTEQATVRVLGTAFNVQAYTGDEATRVAVSEGTVALRAERPARSEPDTTVVLTSRHLGVVSGEGAPTVQQGVDVARYLAWTQGRLVFKDASFDDVVRRLERWYDLQIEVRVPFDAVVALNASFDDESLREVLSTIAVVLNLKYDRQGRSVTFYRWESSRTAPPEHTAPVQQAFVAK